MLKMSEADQDRTTRLEVHPARQVDVGLLPESPQLVNRSGLALNATATHCYTIKVQLKQSLRSGTTESVAQVLVGGDLPPTLTIG